MSIYKLLVINPGSTSTKIAVFHNEEVVLEETLRHSNEELEKYSSIFEQYQFRKDIILDILRQKGIDIKELNAVVGRGGLLKPIPGGTYRVNGKMLDDLSQGTYGEHASNLGGAIAHEIASEANIPSFIVDPVVVDEMEDIARISGMPDIPRICIWHALNQKAVARRFAKDNNKSYEELNLIVAHLGGGISVGAHKKGKVVDVNNALDGEGPFSPERSGGLPVGELAKLCYSGKYTLAEMKKKIKGCGGLVAYLGTNDARKVCEMIEAGDEKAKLIYEAMAYQVAKEISSMSTVLEGQVDGIILTGGIAYDAMFTAWIKERVEFIADVVMYPGEDELIALAEGGLRVLRGEEQAKEYL